MQKIITVLIMVAASTLSYAGYYPALEYQVYGSPVTRSDKVAIDDAMNKFWSAWSEQNAETVAGVHTLDAEWTNAFGRTYRGSKNLETFLKNDLFPAYDSDVSKKEAESFVAISRRYIGSETVVITGRIESDRGSSIGSSNRKVGFTFVLTKVVQEWKISNQVITDIREKRG
jgi:hypothetical protein